MKKQQLRKTLNKMAKEHNVDFDTGSGTKHDKWVFNGQKLIIPRHNEINELPARGIIEAAESTLEEK